MAEFKIYPLNCGSMIRERSLILYNLDPGQKIEMTIYSWYLTDGKHKFLIDTAGEPARGDNRLPYSQGKGQTLSEQLRRIGVAPEEIEAVIITHMHWDHIGNNALFPHAKFYVQKSELEYSVCPMELHKKHYDPLEIFQTSYIPVVGDKKLCDGVRMVHTPGHTPGTQSVLVDTAQGVYAITGDHVPMYESWELTPRRPNGIHTNLIECFESFSKLEELADMVLPGHDPLVGKVPCYPAE